MQSPSTTLSLAQVTIPALARASTLPCRVEVWLWTPPQRAARLAAMGKGKELGDRGHERRLREMCTRHLRSMSEEAIAYQLTRDVGGWNGRKSCPKSRDATSCDASGGTLVFAIVIRREDPQRRRGCPVCNAVYSTAAQPAVLGPEPGRLAVHRVSHQMGPYRAPERQFRHEGPPGRVLARRTKPPR